MSFSRRTSAIAAAAFSLSILATGCNTKVSQCNKLIKVGNAAATELKPIAKSQGSTLKDKMAQMEKLAVGFEKYAQEVKTVSLEDETLKGLQTRLSDLYANGGKASRGMISALKGKDRKGLMESLKTISKGSKTEKKIADDIRAYCQG